MKRLLALVLLAGVAHADDTVTVRAKQNESVSMLASEFYGDRSKFPYIIAENRFGFTRPRPLAAGQRLRIPILREYTTSPGDSFATLAKDLLGDERRAQFLADANHLPVDESLAAGTALIIPFAVTHIAEKPESLAQIAAIYYSEPKLGELLRNYNSFEKTALEKGESVIVPSVGVKLHPAKLQAPDADARERRERRRDLGKLAASALPTARHAWRIGEFETVQLGLVDIDTAFLEVGPATEVGVLLGSAQIAVGDLPAARETFARVLKRSPNHTLRKVDHSPKVLAVWTKASGKVE